MASGPVVVEVPEKVLQAEKTDEVPFAIKLCELARLSSVESAPSTGCPRSLGPSGSPRR